MATMEESAFVFDFFDKIYQESDPHYDTTYNAENFEQAKKYYYGEDPKTKSFKERVDCVYAQELPKLKYTYYIEKLQKHENKEKSYTFITTLLEIMDDVMAEYAGYDEDGCPYDDDFDYTKVYTESFGGPPINTEDFEREFWEK